MGRMDDAVNAVNKIGILLTRFPTKSIYPHFINITHHEWIHAVKNKLPKELTDRTKILFNDFVMTIDKLSNLITEEEKSLYLCNRDKINALVDISTRYKNWLQGIFRDKYFVKGLFYTSKDAGMQNKSLSIVHDDRANS